MFSLDYTINSEGLASGGNMPDFSILLLDFTTFTPVVHSGALTTSGVFTSPILASGDYQFFVQNFDAQSSQLNDLGTTSTSLDADFGFGLTSVPEPGSWLLMGLGFGVLGVNGAVAIISVSQNEGLRNGHNKRISISKAERTVS